MFRVQKWPQHLCEAPSWASSVRPGAALSAASGASALQQQFKLIWWSHLCLVLQHCQAQAVCAWTVPRLHRRFVLEAPPGKHVQSEHLTQCPLVSQHIAAGLVKPLPPLMAYQCDFWARHPQCLARSAAAAPPALHAHPPATVLPHSQRTAVYPPATEAPIHSCSTAASPPVTHADDPASVTPPLQQSSTAAALPAGRLHTGQWDCTRANTSPLFQILIAPDNQLLCLQVTCTQDYRRFHHMQDALPQLPQWADPGLTWAPSVIKAGGSAEGHTGFRAHLSEALRGSKGGRCTGGAAAQAAYFSCSWMCI